MGFLDHSTNNIIIDAVLTDYGRRLLAENQGAFKIAFFSLGDDEIDYTTIKKFGRTVGKEKIAKNTPIFEAQTAATQALKHRLITLPDPLVSKMPSMKFTVSEGGTSSTTVTNLVTMTSEQSLATVKFEQEIGTSGTVPDGLSDQTYTILINDRFFSLTSGVKINTQPNSRIAAYSQTKTSISSTTNASNVEVKLQRKTLDDTTYPQFGDYSNKNQITTVVSVIGDQSGLRKDIKVQFTKP
jgi:hypothetical protein